MGRDRPVPVDAGPGQARPLGRALESHVCYPIEPEQFWKLFLPGCSDWAADAARGATFVHVWSEAIVWSGYDFWSCPPAGSYLHEAFPRAGVLGASGASLLRTRFFA